MATVLIKKESQEMDLKNSMVVVHLIPVPVEEGGEEEVGGGEGGVGVEVGEEDDNGKTQNMGTVMIITDRVRMGDRT